MSDKLSEQGDKARKALHDMRWGPHIEDIVERQEAMDNAIKTALHAVAALEQNVAASEAALEINDGFLTGVEEKLEKAEQRVELIDQAEAQMIGEDARPHTEWLWYFDALEETT